MADEKFKGFNSYRGDFNWPQAKSKKPERTVAPEEERSDAETRLEDLEKRRTTAGLEPAEQAELVSLKKRLRRSE